MTAQRSYLDQQLPRPMRLTAVLLLVASLLAFTVFLAAAAFTHSAFIFGALITGMLAIHLSPDRHPKAPHAPTPLDKLHEEYFTDRIGIHELEARVLEIHRTGSDPGHDGILNLNDSEQINRLRKERTPSDRMLEELYDTFNRRHGKPTTALPHPWLMDHSGCPVLLDSDGHVIDRRKPEEAWADLTLHERNKRVKAELKELQAGIERLERETTRRKA